jgi:two-component system chemotaxis response regulator CheY
MRVLIVDDSSLVRGYLRIVLQAAGAVCVEASQGLEALQVLRGVTGFDLMLLDVNMPVMGGLECVSVVRKSGLGLGMKIVLMTAGSEGFEKLAVDCGADKVLLKPFLVDRLWAALSGLGLPVGRLTAAA